MPRLRRTAVLLQIAMLCFSFFSRGATAAEPEEGITIIPAPSVVRDPDAAKILSLTNQLILEEIDLERFYLIYRVRGSKQSKYRRIRYFLAQQAATSAALTSNIINTVETAKHFSTPDQVSGQVFVDSNRVGLVGAILGASSSSFELCSNGCLALKNKWTKNDPETAVEVVLEKLKVIDELIASRNKLVSDCGDASLHAIYIAEGEVLKSFRDWCAYEFADVYSDVKSSQSSYNVFYALDIAAYSTSCASYILSIKSYKNEPLSFPSLHTAFVCDSLFTAETPISTQAYKRFYAHSWNKFSKRLGEQLKDEEIDAKKNMIHLENLAAVAEDSELSKVGPIAARLAVYSFWSTRYDRYIDYRLAEIRRQSKIALQGTISGPLLGATGLAQDASNAIGLYRYKKNPYMQNALGFASAVTGTCSAITSLGLTGWNFADQILDDKENRRDKLLPELLLQERLQTLSTLEDMLGVKK